MFNMKKIVSMIAAVAFIFNCVASDVAFAGVINQSPNTDHLAAPSALDDIGGMELKDKSRIHIALRAMLEGQSVEELLSSNENPSHPEFTIFNPANTQFFFAEPPDQTPLGSAYRARIFDLYGLRTYYVAFKDDRYRIFTEEQYTETDKLSRNVPASKDEDDVEIARYIQHENIIDPFIASHMQDPDGHLIVEGKQKEHFISRLFLNVPVIALNSYFNNSNRLA